MSPISAQILSGDPKRPTDPSVSPLTRHNLRALLTGSTEPLQTLQVDPAAIHITLGIKESVVIRNPPRDASGAYVGEPTLFWKEPTGREDMGIEGVWERRAPGLAPGDYHL